MKRYGAAQLGGTDFSEAVERELEKLQHAREANAAKMHAAQTGELGPSEFQEQQQKQAGALQRQATTQGAQQALQAQAGMKPPNAPPAPSGPAGVTKPYAAQAKPGAVPTTGETKSQPAPSEEEGPEEAQ